MRERERGRERREEGGGENGKHKVRRGDVVEELEGRWENRGGGEGEMRRYSDIITLKFVNSAQ